jgi:hypothetical protein
MRVQPQFSSSSLFETEKMISIAPENTKDHPKKSARAKNEFSGEIKL